MRVAVIGCGSIGRRHINNLKALDCDIYVCDIWADVTSAICEEFHVEVWHRHAVDAWVIATPYDQHLRFAEAAIAQGAPFFIEKPLGSFEQLPRWRELAAMDLPVNQVGYMLRFHPKAQAMKVLFPSPDWVNTGCETDMSQWPGHSYGPLLLEASHELDLALWLGAGVVRNVRTARDGTLYIEMSNGASTLSNKNSAPWARPGRYHRAWMVGDGDDMGAEAVFTSPEQLGDQMYRDELAHFLECVRENKPTLCPLSDGLKVLEVCAQIEAMAHART